MERMPVLRVYLFQYVHVVCNFVEAVEISSSASCVVPLQPDDTNSTTQANAAVAHKEKSVLQAKLTKLAIQIGYAGETVISTLLIILLVTSVVNYRILLTTPPQ